MNVRVGAALHPSRLLLLVSLSTLVSCASAIPPGEINELYKDVIYQRDTQYRIKAGDVLNVRFLGQAEFDQALTVLPDGRTDPFFMNNPIVAEKSINELEEEIRRFYANELRNPEIQIQVQPAGEFVYLEGAVTRPATTPYTLKMTLSQLVANAGGYRDTASADEVILKRPYRNPRKPDIFIIDLYDESEEIFLLPNDHIIVERNWWIVIRDYLREFIWGMLPFDPRALLFTAA